MPAVLGTLEGTIAKMAAYLGTRWPNPWWPTGVSAYDDCAACVSWALFGLNGRQPFQTYVSGVIERSGLEFHRGSSGLRRGDAVGFLWGGNNNYDHIELALSSPDGAGNFQTIGTNASPTDNMAVRWRNTRYVVAYGRPGYLSPAGGGESPIEEDDFMAMSKADYDYLLNAVRRSSAGRLFYDAGASGALTPADFWTTNCRAAIGRPGKVRALPTNAKNRKAMIDAERAAGDGLFLALAEQPDGLATTAYNWELEWLSDGPSAELGSFVANTFELASGPTQQVYERLTTAYNSRQDVWRDARPVSITRQGKPVTGFKRLAGKSYAVIGGQNVELTAAEVARADAQLASGQVWATS